MVQRHRKSPTRSDLLVTKLTPPVIRSLLVKRVRLVKLLQTGMEKKLSLVIAPAGYGKTTLFGEWLASIADTRWKVAWVSLDDYDNEPSRFWSYVIDALETIRPGLQFDIIKTREISENGLGQPALVSLINQIASTRDDFSLILDDYHLIQTSSIHSDLAFLIEHMPEQMHIVLASRVLPEIPLSGLRVRNQLVEIDAGDMAFSMIETETFLHEVMGLDLDATAVDALVDITEGWVAGLQLAALSLQGKPDYRRLVVDFTGSNRHIVEYFTEQVLTHLDEGTQDFLLKTSTLNEFSVPLCDFLLNRQYSQIILKKIERAQLFIVSLDEQHTWYRYHPLFADSLRSLLKQKSPDLSPQLQHRACMWLWQNGFADNAVPYALAAGDLELAAEIVETCAMQSLLDFDLVKPVNWINRFSEKMIFQRPNLGVYYAVANYHLGYLELIEPKLQITERAIEQAQRMHSPIFDERRIKLEIASIRAAIACIQENFMDGITQAQEILGNLQKEDVFYYGFLTHYMAYAYETAGDLIAAEKAFLDGIQNAILHNLKKESVFSLCETARIRKERGFLDQAKEIYQQALDLGNQLGLDRAWLIYPQSGLAEIYLEWNDLESAEQWIREAEEYFKKVDVRVFGWVNLLTLSFRIIKFQLARGDLPAASVSFRKLQNSVEQYHFKNTLFGAVVEIQVLLWLAKGEIRKASLWLNEKTAAGATHGVQIPAKQMAFARVYAALNRPQESLLILHELEIKARNSRSVETLIQILCLKTTMLLLLDKAREEAKEAISEALILGSAGGYMRTFVDAGQHLKPLLEEMAENQKKNILGGKDGIDERYLQSILAAFSQSTISELSEPPDPETRTIMLGAAQEVLTERETQVLQMLSEGYTVKELAFKLMITNNTAKVHIKNIYEKLKVHTRKELIQRVQELNLL